MNDRDKALMKLQSIDSDIDSLKREADALPEKEELRATEARLIEVNNEHGEADEKLAEIEHAQKKLEDESSRLEDKIKNEEKKLYAGTIGNPKELMALQHEIGVLSSEKDDIDTEFLVGEDDLQESRRNSAGLKDSEAELSEKKDSLTATVMVKLKEIDDKISGLEKSREEPLKELDSLSLRVYDQMRIKGHGSAVVEASEGICGGCHLENSEDSGHGATDGPVRRCEYCHRILITS